MYKYFLLVFILFFISFSYGLKITEVYFDGTNEYIGIYNETNKLFSGAIILSGAKSSNIKLNIIVKPQEEIIIGDKLDNIIDNVQVFKTGLGLSLTDSSAINIDLISSTGEILDTFYVDTGTVKKFDNKKTAFEKIMSGNTWKIQDVKTIKNAKNGYIINPSYVEISIGGENMVVGTNNIVQSISCYLKLEEKDNKFNFLYTGNLEVSNIVWYKDGQKIGTGQTMSISKGNYTIKGVGQYMSGNVCTGNYGIYFKTGNVDIFTGKLQITEIYPKTNNFDEYVELKAFGNVSGTFLLDGFARGTKQLTLSTKLYSGNFLILAKSYSGFLYTGNVIVFDSLSLLDNGEKLSISQNGQVIDNVKYNKGESLYYDYNSGNIRYFDKNDTPTPGYDLYIKSYYKANDVEKTSCSIILQSYEFKDDKIKVNFKTDIGDDGFCSDRYKQIWTYSSGITTGTCNPSYFYLSGGNQTINFQIKNNSGNVICSDDFNLFYFKEKQEQENLNCYIKIQTKKDAFLSKDSINFITVVNNKEIQNSNINYTCIYSFSGQVLSNKCNPDSLKLDGGLYKIDLQVESKTGQTCQTRYYLNLPKENIKTINSTYEISQYDCAKLSSIKLTELTKLIDNKYKTTYTKKKIFDPIKYLYVKEDTNVLDECVSLNSDKLKELVLKIKGKYKSQSTLDKIFGKLNNTKINSGFDLKIISLLPYPETNKLEEIILSGQYLYGLSIFNGTKNYKLGTGIKLKNGNYKFIGRFGLKNNFGCVNLIKNDFVVDSICYKNVTRGKYISKFYKTDKIDFINDYIVYMSNGKLNIVENKSLLNLKSRLKKGFKKIEQIFNKLQKKSKKYKKLYVKESYKAMYNFRKYNLLKIRYDKLKQEFKIDKKKKYEKLKDKNSFIKQLKNQISFLRSFILSVKTSIDKKAYQQYLKDYKKVKQGMKIRY